ncbi:MAG: hypothetical protein Q9217_002749 [Psora testacea]
MILDYTVDEPLNREPAVHELVESFITKKNGYDRNHGPIPHLEVENHVINIDGDVWKPLELTVDQLKTEYPQHDLISALQCAGNRRHTMRTLLKEVDGIDWGDAAVMNCKWRGPRLRDILIDAGVSRKTGHVAFSCYQTRVQGAHCYGIADDGKMNDETLTPNHGFPVRVIVPGVSGCRSVKWLDRITVQPEESTNLYQRYDYKRLPPEATDREAAQKYWDITPALQDMPINSVIAIPKTGQTVTLSPSGNIEIKGYALPQAHQGPVVKVEVSTDEGCTWQNAEITAGGEGESKWAWSLWKATVRLKKGKCRRLLSRATDSGGNVQNAWPQWNLRGVGVPQADRTAEFEVLFDMLHGINDRELEAPTITPDLVTDGDATTFDSSLAQVGESDNSVDKTPNPSKRNRLSSLKRTTKAKTKSLFIGKDVYTIGNSKEEEKAQVMKDIENDPAFNTSHLVSKERVSVGGAAGKTRGALRSVGKSVMHPKDAIKSKAKKTTAGQLSKTERPYLSQEADLDFLQAHDDLRRAESASSSRPDISDEEIDPLISEHKNKLREMEAYRESLQAAWITSRHVRRVRVVPKRHITFPNNEYFVERDERGNVNLIYYTQDFSAQYIDEFDELPFDIDSLRLYVERFVMASAPWQSWAMNVRTVYRWENPKTTTKWFALYLVLWYTQHMMAFFYAYILYIVLKNWYYPTNAESLRGSMERAHDSRSKAYKFGELIDKHGRHNWLEPVMNDLGPSIQVQLGDLANMLEVFSNFYHWKNPRKTRATLIFFASCLLVSLFADMAFCMKIVWFIVGGSFFLCWPIASLYPKYRYLVSPFKWVLWDIPTHAEWSLQYLRRQAQSTREQLIKVKIGDGLARESANPVNDKYNGHITALPRIKVDNDTSSVKEEEEEEDDADSDSDSRWQSACSTTSVLEASDIRSFRARSKGITGRLIIFSNGVRFSRSAKKKEIWRVRFIELSEMRKVQGSGVSNLVWSPDQLVIKSVDGREFNIEGMKARDDVFNTIIAFSGLQWQSLQIRHEKKG